MSRVNERLTAADGACRLKLREDPFLKIMGRLGSLANPSQAFELLSRIRTDPAGTAELADLCGLMPSEQGQGMVERTLLMLASLHAIPQVPSLDVSDTVKGLFAEEFQFFSEPPAVWTTHFRWDDVRFREMARIATLRRFPAGQFDWEVSGFPRSWLARASRPLSLLAYLAQMGGFGPVFEMHVNPRRKNQHLLEKEANFSYYRAARSIVKQSAIRGLMMGSWFLCGSTAQVTPRLAWLRQLPQSGGALLFDIGPAAADSGFMTGSYKRRRLYEEGLYRPKLGYILWPRKHLIDWANRHPEFDV